MQISPRDIEWIGEDPGVCNRYGLNRTTGPNNVPQRGSGLAKTTIKNDLRTSQNGAGKRKHVDIRIRPTNVLIREVGTNCCQDSDVCVVSQTVMFF